MQNEFTILFRDAKKIYLEASARYDEAWNSFNYDPNRLHHWDEFRDLAIRFDWHVEQHLLGLHQRGLTTYPTKDVEFAWRRCLSHISDAFGPSGFKSCFDRILSGADGGAPAVLREFGQSITDGFVTNLTRGLISAYWDHLTFEQKLAEPIAYVNTWRHTLPPDMTEDGGWRIRSDFRTFLGQHILAMRRQERMSHE